MPTGNTYFILDVKLKEEKEMGEKTPDQSIVSSLDPNLCF